MADVFISYKREDYESVHRLVAALQADGLGVWWDQLIAPDASWEATIERELGTAKAVIVCWSRTSVNSDNVKAEGRRARQDGRLIQVFLEDCDPPLFFGERQGVNLRGWGGSRSNQQYSLLLEALRALMQGRRPPREVGYVPRRTPILPLVGVAALTAMLAVVGVVLFRGNQTVTNPIAEDADIRALYRTAIPTEFTVGQEWGRFSIDGNCDLKFGNAVVHSFEYIGGDNSNGACEYYPLFSPSPSGRTVLVFAPINDYGYDYLAIVDTVGNRVVRESAPFRMEGVRETATAGATVYVRENPDIQGLRPFEAWSDDERYAALSAGGHVEPRPCVLDTQDQQLRCPEEREFSQAINSAVRSTTAGACLSQQQSVPALYPGDTGLVPTCYLGWELTSAAWREDQQKFEARLDLAVWDDLNGEAFENRLARYSAQVLIAPDGGLSGFELNAPAGWQTQ